MLPAASVSGTAPRIILFRSKSTSTTPAARYLCKIADMQTQSLQKASSTYSSYALAQLAIKLLYPPPPPSPFPPLMSQQTCCNTKPTWGAACAGPLPGRQLGNSPHDDVQVPRRSAPVCHRPSLHLWRPSHLLRGRLLRSMPSRHRAVQRRAHTASSSCAGSNSCPCC